MCTDAAAAAAKKTAKVMFDYEATQVDELTIKVDDIVEVISDEEPGWYVCMPLTHTHTRTRTRTRTHTHTHTHNVYN